MNEEENNRNNLMQRMEEDAPDPEGETPSMLDQPVTEQVPREERSQQERYNSSGSTLSAPVKINYSQSNLDEMEELIESVVEEKWRSLVENFGDMGLWKDKVRTEILSIKQELVRLENRFENIQKAVLGKIRTYDENIIEVGSEIKALEKVFGKIIDPLTTNIKELDRITKQLKK